MKTIALMAALAACVSLPTLAEAKGGGGGGGGGGERCNVRHLAGEWLTAFEYGADGSGAVACRIAVSRNGTVVRAFCLQDDIGTRVPAVGSFAVGTQCEVTGEMTVGLDTFDFSGELARDRDLIVGLVKHGTTFDPVAIVRTGNPSKGRKPKIENPIDDDDDEEESHFACAAEAVDIRMEVEYEQIEADGKIERYQLEAELEAQPGGVYPPSTVVALVVDGVTIGSKSLKEIEESGELEVEFGFNSRKGGFPPAMPDLAAGTEVAFAVGGSTVVSCELVEGDDD
jgi:hypothetical protein